jgi:hypothetical protein
MYIIQFGGYQFPTDQLELTETSGANRRGATVALGGMGGSWDELGLGSDPLAEDTITKTIVLEGVGASQATRQASLRTQFDALLGAMMTSALDWRQGARLLLAQLPDGSKRGAWAKCVECRARWEYYNINEAWLPVSITWRRTWPVWERIFLADPFAAFFEAMYLGDQLGTFSSTAAAGYVCGSNHSALATWSMSNGLTVTFTNAGNAPQPNVIVEFDGQITNPKLENLTNKQWLQWSGTLAAADRVTVRTPSATARLNGVLQQSGLTIGNGRGQLLPMIMEPGANSLRLTGSGTISGLLKVWSPDAYF